MGMDVDALDAIMDWRDPRWPACYAAAAAAAFAARPLTGPTPVYLTDETAAALADLMRRRMAAAALADLARRRMAAPVLQRQVPPAPAPPPGLPLAPLAAALARAMVARLLRA
jgi:hypothetical protein